MCIWYLRHGADLHLLPPHIIDALSRGTLIPSSFGRFRHGLTLHCVCGECNQFFGKHLELHFARETGESIVDSTMASGINGLGTPAAA